MKNCGLAPFEIEEGFDAFGKQATELLLSRAQWANGKRRIVVVHNSQARKIVKNKLNDHRLHLFSEDQTEPIEMESPDYSS
jgi:hypothetical protein